MTQVKLVLGDVDGTLVTNDKTLTDATIDAVERLRDAGILFAITSGRPPRGLMMFVRPLSIVTPIATFNGAMFVDTELNVLEEHSVPGDSVGPVLEAIASRGVDVWVYKGVDWLVPDPGGAHVARETATVRFAPTVMPDFSELTDDPGDVAKIVAVSDDVAVLSALEADLRQRFAAAVSITRSQPYYIDLTHSEANKGSVVDYYVNKYDIPTGAIATIGDMPTDTAMFARSGLSVAMGNASNEVKRLATHVTASNEEEGFALAVDRFILSAVGSNSPEGGLI